MVLPELLDSRVDNDGARDGRRHLDSLRVVRLLRQKKVRPVLLQQSPHSLDGTNHELIGASLRGMDETLCRIRHATGGRRWATLHVRCRTSSSSGGTIPQCEAMPQSEFS